MAESYLSLSPDEQRHILQGAASTLGRQATVLEKDIWVCWTLQALFSMPNAYPMAFKGGTSLSKVYGVIDRFSEDVDITLDYRAFNDDFDPFTAGSNNQIRKFSERLRGHVKSYANDVMAPFLRDQLAELDLGDRVGVEIDETGEKLWVTYPSVTEEVDEYLKSAVLIELGGRNVIDPNERHHVSPMIEALTSGLTYPSSEITVLSGKRTFWEKATLIHVACNRGQLKQSAARLSRHWYDLVKLADHPMGKAAIEDRALLEDVVRHKKVFFHAGYANYDGCLAGELRLLPDPGVLEALRDDYEQMIRAGMMYEEPPGFEELTEKLRQLQAKLNVG